MGSAWSLSKLHDTKVVTFNDTKGRDAYLPHPAHKAFGKVLRPYLDKVLVIDFVAKD